MPASRARWMIRMLSSWSGLPQAPNIMVPSVSGLTWTPVRAEGSEVGVVAHAVSFWTGGGGVLAGRAARARSARAACCRSYSVRNSPRSLQDRDHVVDERVEARRQQRRHDVEAVGGAVLEPLLDLVGDLLGRADDDPVPAAAGEPVRCSWRTVGCSRSDECRAIERGAGCLAPSSSSVVGQVRRGAARRGRRSERSAPSARCELRRGTYAGWIRSVELVARSSLRLAPRCDPMNGHDARAGS